MAGADNKGRRRRSVRKATKNHFLITKNAKNERKEKLKKISEILKKPESLRTIADKILVSKNPEIVKTSEKNAQRLKERKERILEIEDEPSVLDFKCMQLAELIKSSKFIVVYTGAGISTAASIPDYRGPNGVWTLMKRGQEMSAQDLSDAEPTLTHMSLTGLYKCGKVKHVVSQNCDGLHVRSGLPRSALSELHGNMYIECCYSCTPHKEYVRLFDVTERTSIHRHTTDRCCHICGANLKDTIVHFGEKGKLTSPYRWKEAVRAAKKTDLIICLGSSLKVLRKYSSLWCMDKKPKHRPKLVVVNLQWTPKDDVATLKINGKCDSVMLKVMDCLSYKIPVYKREEDPIFTLHCPLRSNELKTTSKKILTVPTQLVKTKQQRKRKNANNKSLPNKLVQNHNSVVPKAPSVKCAKKDNSTADPNCSNKQNYPVIRTLLGTANKSTCGSSLSTLESSSNLSNILDSLCTHVNHSSSSTQQRTSPQSSHHHMYTGAVQIKESTPDYYEDKHVHTVSEPDLNISMNEVKCEHGTDFPELVVIDLEKTENSLTNMESQVCGDGHTSSLELRPNKLSQKNDYHSCQRNIEAIVLLNCEEVESWISKLTSSLIQCPLLTGAEPNPFFVTNAAEVIQGAHNEKLCKLSNGYNNSVKDILLSKQTPDVFDSKDIIHLDHSKDIVYLDHRKEIIHLDHSKEIIHLDHCYCQKLEDIPVNKGRQIVDDKVMPILSLERFPNLSNPGQINATSTCTQNMKHSTCTQNMNPSTCTQNLNRFLQKDSHLVSPVTYKTTTDVDDLRCLDGFDSQRAKVPRTSCFIESLNLDCDQYSLYSPNRSTFYIQNSTNELSACAINVDNETMKVAPNTAQCESIETVDQTPNKRKLTFASVPGWYGKGLGLKKKRR